MLKISKANITLIVITILVVLLTLSGLSYAYFKISIEKNSEGLVGTIKDLDIEYSDTDSIDVKNILPGWSYTKTVTITNNENIPVYYDLNFINYRNTFETGKLVYSVSSTVGSISQRSLPYPYISPTKINLFTNLALAANSSITYTFTFNYIETNDFNYGPDGGKNFSALISLDDGTPTLYSKIINVATGGKSDASLSFDTAPTASTTGLYYTSNDLYGEESQRVYYYRGNVTNNWVSLGGYKWRIVRTTSEGGVKLIYSGVISNDLKAYNSSTNSKFYTGYTYDTNLESYVTEKSNQVNSTIKNEIDTWYSTNLSSYSSYLSATAIYCNDRSEETIVSDGIRFPAWSRINAFRPTFKCAGNNSSRYTASTTTGNGYLDYPISMLNFDEALYSGLLYNSTESVSYLESNISSWWLMTPYRILVTDGVSTARMLFVNNTGSIGVNAADNTKLIRPVISLKSCITVTGGDGSEGTPYQITNESC